MIITAIVLASIATYFIIGFKIAQAGLPGMIERSLEACGYRDGARLQYMSTVMLWPIMVFWVLSAQRVDNYKTPEQLQGEIRDLERQLDMTRRY